MPNEFIARNGVIAQNNSTVTGSLNVTNGITGSLLGTASFAATASYLSGYVSPFPYTGSAIISGSLIITGSSTSLFGYTGSLLGTASFAVFASTASVATTASYINPLNQPVVITGSLTVSGSITSTSTITAQTLVVQTITSSVLYSSGSNVFGNALSNTQIMTGSVSITGSLTLNNIAIPTSASLASTYLPLAGGTLTGALGGTSATFSQTVTATNGVIVGDSKFYNSVQLTDSLNGTTQGWMWLGAASRLDFGLGTVGAGNIKMSLSGSGNVGIGTTAPAGKLDVYVGSYQNLIFKAESANQSSLRFNESTNGPRLYSDAGTEEFRMQQSYTGTGFLTFYTGPTERMRITPSGNVGIGINPKTILQINGGSGAYPTLGTNVTNSFFVGRNDGVVGMYLGYAADGNGWIQQMRNDGATAYNLILQPVGGSVGIGTTSPVSLLTVATGNVTNAGQWTSSAIALYNPTNTGAYSQISFGYTVSTTNASAYIGYVSTNQNSNGFGDLVFGTRNVSTDTQPSERMRITSTGTVQPGANGTQDLGTSSLRWATVYTSDLSLSNGIGDYTIVEGEDDLFLYNNKSNKVYKFMLAEVDPANATPKKSI